MQTKLLNEQTLTFNASFINVLYYLNCSDKFLYFSPSIPYSITQKCMSAKVQSIEQAQILIVSDQDFKNKNYLTFPKKPSWIILHTTSILRHGFTRLFIKNYLKKNYQIQYFYISPNFENPVTCLEYDRTLLRQYRCRMQGKRLKFWYSFLPSNLWLCEYAASH